MPSSSNRSTYTELNLVYLYRIAFARLTSTGLHSQAQFITAQFADALDIDTKELTKALKPSYDPIRSGSDSWRADVKHWNELRASNIKMKRSSKICSAGNALSDAGTGLAGFGRHVEGDRFCGWAQELFRWSLEEMEREDAVRGPSYGSIEMELD